jgi:hypothetical protein
MFSLLPPSLSTFSAHLISFELMYCKNTDVSARTFYNPIHIVRKQSLLTLEALSIKRNRVFCLVPSGGLMWIDIAWCGLLWIDIAWCGLMWLDVASCGLMWLDVDWCGLMWLPLKVTFLPDNAASHTSIFFHVWLLHLSRRRVASKLCKLWQVTATRNTFINPLTPELNPSAHRCLKRIFPGGFASWTVHFVNVSVKNQQMQQLLIQFINYVW